MEAEDGKGQSCSRWLTQANRPLLAALSLWFGLAWDLKRFISSSRCVLLSSCSVLAPRHAQSFYLSLGLQDLIAAHKMTFEVV